MATSVHRQETPGTEGALRASGRVLARHWRRRLGMLLLVVVALVASALIWRATCLIGLPDIGDPFDVAAFRAYHVPEEEDAFVVYREAGARLKSSTMTQNPQWMWKLLRGGWSTASPEVRAWVDQNREALAIWRRGTERPKAMPVAPADLKLDSQSLRELEKVSDLAWISLLEGARLEESGDMAGAWGWYNASLRASRHVRMHAPTNYLFAGMMLHDLAVIRVPVWAADPKVDASTLRKALQDLQEIEAMTGPNTEAIQADYLAFLWALDHPDRWLVSDLGWVNIRGDLPALFRTVVFLKREPERSRRVLKILFAHWLAHADDPPQSRPKMSETRVDGNNSYPDFPYYAAPGTRDPAHPFSSEKMYKWLQSTIYARTLGFHWKLSIPASDGERVSQRILIITLAEQLYQREHGRLPGKAEDLVGPGYLKELPEGYGTIEFEKQLPRK